MGDTIFALSSGAARAGVAVIRLSGPAALASVAALTDTPLPAPRVARVRRLRAPGTGELLDAGLVLLFPGPHSFTGEDCAELHVHGGPAVVRGVLDALADLPDLRPAEAGEFTLRAFRNGRLDLAAAEGLADLIAAETAAQRRLALAQAGGALARAIDDLRGPLVAALAHVEAGLDFPDEDLPPGLDVAARREIAGLAARIEAQLAGAAAARRVRTGMSVALLGAPNAGKSSLLNALAGADVAIVSPIAGTTRDVVSTRLDLHGHLVTLSDTAGLRTSGDAIEAEGVRRATALAGAADLRIGVAEAQAPDPAVLDLLHPGDVLFLNKTDLGPPAPDAAAAGAARGFVVLGGSARTGAGIGALLDALARAAGAGASGEAPLLLVRARHASALREAADRLAAALAHPPGAEDLVAEDLRLALRALGRVTGRVDVEEVLDRVFAEFCIGK